MSDHLDLGPTDSGETDGLGRNRRGGVVVEGGEFFTSTFDQTSRGRTTSFVVTRPFRRRPFKYRSVLYCVRGVRWKGRRDLLTDYKDSEREKSSVIHRDGSPLTVVGPLKRGTLCLFFIVTGSSDFSLSATFFLILSRGPCQISVPLGERHTLVESLFVRTLFQSFHWFLLLERSSEVEFLVVLLPILVLDFCPGNFGPSLKITTS